MKNRCLEIFERNLRMIINRIKRTDIDEHDDDVDER
jgi:hypothetical protein